MHGINSYSYSYRCNIIHVRITIYLGSIAVAACMHGYSIVRAYVDKSLSAELAMQAHQKLNLHGSVQPQGIAMRS